MKVRDNVLALDLGQLGHHRHATDHVARALCLFSDSVGVGQTVEAGLQAGDVLDHGLRQQQFGVQFADHLPAHFGRRLVERAGIFQVHRKAEVAFTAGGLERYFFQFDVRLGGQQFRQVGIHLCLIGNAQFQLERYASLRGSLLLRLDFLLEEMEQCLRGRNVEVTELPQHLRGADVLAVVVDHADVVGHLRRQVTVCLLHQAGVHKVLEPHRWLVPDLEQRAGHLEVAMPEVETRGAFGTTGVEGHAVEFNTHRALFRRYVELQVVHIAGDLELLCIGTGRHSEVEAGELEHAVFVIDVQWQQLQGAFGSAVVADARTAFERRGTIGQGKPLFGEGVFLDFIVAGSHDRQQLQRLQSRKRQRPVLDVIHKQQLDFFVVFAQIFALNIHTIMRGAGEQMALKRHQLDAHAVVGSAKRRLELSVGVVD